MKNKPVIVIVDSLLDFETQKYGSGLYGNCLIIETNTVKYCLIKDIPTLICYFNESQHFVKKEYLRELGIGVQGDAEFGDKIIIGKNLPNKLENVSSEYDYFGWGYLEPRNKEEAEYIIEHFSGRGLFGLHGFIYENTMDFIEQFENKLIPLLSWLNMDYTSKNENEDKNCFALDKVVMAGLGCDQIEYLLSRGFNLRKNQFCDKIIDRIQKDDLNNFSVLRTALKNLL